LTKRLLSEIALNSPPMANGNAARHIVVERWGMGRKGRVE
jgi:hypothetical protein